MLIFRLFKYTILCIFLFIILRKPHTPHQTPNISSTIWLFRLFIFCLCTYFYKRIAMKTKIPQQSFSSTWKAVPSQFLFIFLAAGLYKSSWRYKLSTAGEKKKCSWSCNREIPRRVCVYMRKIETIYIKWWESKKRKKKGQQLMCQEKPQITSLTVYNSFLFTFLYKHLYIRVYIYIYFFTKYIAILQETHQMAHNISKRWI